GKLGIQVLTDNDRQKSEAIAALGSLALRSTVELEVSTFQEAAKRRPSPSSDNLVVKRIEVDRERIPVYSDLKSYFSAGPAGPGQGASDEAAVDRKIERFAAGILRRSRQALQHAWALKHHAEESQGPLSTEQRSLLAEMIADHLKVIESDAARLE